ncbi:MAG TPA: DUF2378 family protein [Polyangiaceae bacterium]|nr:DUF2378 family protein [Polyangiaceae bacterium]
MPSTRAISLPPAEARLDAELAAYGLSAAHFRSLDAREALDVDARIRETPLEKQTKGMFFEAVTRAGRNLGVVREQRYVSFRDYSLRDFMQLVAEYARARYPGIPVRDALRRVGSEAYAALMSSVAGRVLFALTGGDVQTALRLAPEAYRHSLSHCAVSVRVDQRRQVVLEFRDVWNFPDCYQVGVVEGACRAFGVDARVRTLVHSACDVDMLVRW